MFVDRPGEWLADQVRGKRVGVYGLDYVMTVRDYRALDGAAEIVPWDVEFDHARAVKSELELESVRESVRINTEGFWMFLEHFAPGKTEREILAPLRGVLRRAGLRPADDGHGPRRRRTALPCRSSRSPATTRSRRATWCCRRSRSPAPAATGSRYRVRSAPGEPSDETKQMMDAYEEYYEAARVGAARTARPRTTSTAPSRRGSSIAASCSATSPATRSG